MLLTSTETVSKCPFLCTPSLATCEVSLGPQAHRHLLLPVLGGLYCVVFNYSDANLHFLYTAFSQPPQAIFVFSSMTCLLVTVNFDAEPFLW